MIGGGIRRLPVTGETTAPDERFCTSGHASGVSCVWSAYEAGHVPDFPVDFPHQLFAHSSQLSSIISGDSGGPVFTYDRRMIGVLSGTRYYGSILFSTPMSQVLEDFPPYRLALGD